MTLTAEPKRCWRVENEAIFRDTINAAAEQLALQPLAVEKDYWVCEALRAIETHAPGETIFKGGTSLEKLRLIKRFSEDLDLLVVGDYATKRAVERALKACVPPPKPRFRTATKRRSTAGVSQVRCTGACI